MTTFWRKVVVSIGYVAAGLLIFAALLVSVTQLLTPLLNEHRADFEKLAGNILNRPVQIGEVKIYWSNFEPELAFRNVVVLNPETNQPNLEIPLIRIDVAILNSLFSRTFILDSLKISGVHLTLHEEKAGEINVAGFNQFSMTDNLTGHSLNPNIVLTWIFSQPKLVLQDFEVQFYPYEGDEKDVTLKWLALTNSSKDHRLTGRAILNQQAPTQATIRFNWEGSITDLANVSADLYLDLQNLSLSQWAAKKTWRDLTLNRGIGSAKIWASWNKNTWQTFKTSLQFYDIEAASLITKKKINIARFSGNLNWQREGDSQVISGDNILIDLSNHLWPTTHFKVTYAPSVNDAFPIKNLEIGYMDLGDAYQLLQASGLLPDVYAQNLEIIKPQGEILDLKTTVKGPIDDPANVALLTKFAALTMNPWKKMPGINQLHGVLNWDGNIGALQLDSPHSAITLNDVFDNALEFDQLNGVFNWQKDANGTWTLTSKNIHAINQDFNATATMSMLFPANDSASINLTGNFTLANAKNISRYLPLKIYPPELNTWLRSAFLSGQVTSGTAILQGKLADFPFDNNSGKFVISGEVKNVELNYAPDWPVIHNINGKLLFSGRSMTADVSSAHILNIPLQNIHAEIPNLGTDPILTAKTTVHSDLAQGLQFVEQSPLNQTIGKNLSALKLQGPMQLALTLNVPLDHPADTKVNGDTTMSNAILNLPDWNLAVDQLNGSFNFTEDSITGSNITARLFGRPISLNLSTQQTQGKTHSFTADLQGAVSTTNLKTWLDLPIENVMQGTTNYKAQLILPSRTSSDPTQVIVNSDLNGISVNLPGNYGKKSEDTADFELSFLIKENQPLKAKVLYNKLFSLAMTLQRVKQKFSLLSADLHLGSGEANWQTQSGIMVTGNIDKINWDAIGPYISQFTTQSKGRAPQKEFINPDLFRGVDIRANTINVSGLQLKNIRVQLTKSGNNYILGLNNPDMAGQITLSRNGIQQGIQARFQRLNLSSQITTTGQGSVNPRQFPPISFVGDDVRYGDMRLGRATINLVPTGSGMVIKQFNLDSPVYTLNATGDWTSARSRLQGKIITTNVTTLLQSWGFSSANLIGSTGNVDFDLNWPGGFFRPSVQGLSGNFSLTLGRGRIINLGDAADAKMGLGRLLNIFSLQSLPNLSAVFEKGYSFDSLTGNFILRNGNAITENTRFKGSIASIGISGRIGLAAKDLDMKLSVTPYVTSSLPVVAAIATANPIAGVATWMVDKMVSPAVSQLTTYNYSITGSWSNPVWNQISTQRQQSSSPQQQAPAR